MNNKNKMIAGVVGLVLFGAGFFAGSSYWTKNLAGNPGGFNGGAGGGTYRGMMGGGRNGMMNSRGGGIVVGSVLSKDAQGLTIQLQTGGSRIVLTSASTTVMKSAAGSIDDLQVGTNVLVQGSANTDGSVTAQSIQIRPAGMMPVRAQ